MTLELLISCVNQDVEELAAKMQLQTNAVIVNQCDKNEYKEFSHEGHTIRSFHMSERGVGLSRNTALLHSRGDILLFADEDIVYEQGYKKIVLDAFASHPHADMLIFNMDVAEDRATYKTLQEKRIRWYNSGRYPTYSMAIKRDSFLKSNVSFSLLFGGGAKYSNGEDSLFIWECLQKNMKVVALPITIGKEVPRPSTWFFGYNEKFFFDRGVLYQRLYGRMAKLFALRFIYCHRKMMFRENGEVNSYNQAYSLMKKGMEEMK